MNDRHNITITINVSKYCEKKSNLKYFFEYIDSVLIIELQRTELIVHMTCFVLHIISKISDKVSSKIAQKK